MSVDYYAVIAYGVLVSPSMKVGENTLRGCTHDVGDECHFCPKCGKTT